MSLGLEIAIVYIIRGGCNYILIYHLADMRQLPAREVDLVILCSVFDFNYLFIDRKCEMVQYLRRKILFKHVRTSVNLSNQVF